MISQSRLIPEPRRPKACLQRFPIPAILAARVALHRSCQGVSSTDGPDLVPAWVNTVRTLVGTFRARKGFCIPCRFGEVITNHGVTLINRVHVVRRAVVAGSRPYSAVVWKHQVWIKVQRDGTGPKYRCCAFAGKAGRVSKDGTMLDRRSTTWPYSLTAFAR